MRRKFKPFVYADAFMMGMKPTATAEALPRPQALELVNIMRGVARIKPLLQPATE